MKTLLDVRRRTALLVATLSLTACGGASATATLASRSGSTVTGEATFVDGGDQVTMSLEVAGASAGNHGAHLHEFGNCSSADALSAGGHWNPSTKTHGTPDANHHLGDLGNIEIGQDGKGKLTLSRADWTVGDGTTTDVVGKAVVIHASEDDLMTDPSGKSGDRQACGVIVRK